MSVIDLCHAPGARQAENEARRNERSTAIAKLGYLLTQMGHPVDEVANDLSLWGRHFAEVMSAQQK